MRLQWVLLLVAECAARGLRGSSAAVEGTVADDAHRLAAESSAAVGDGSSRRLTTEEKPLTHNQMIAKGQFTKAHGAVAGHKTTAPHAVGHTAATPHATHHDAAAAAAHGDVLVYEPGPGELCGAGYHLAGTKCRKSKDADIVYHAPEYGPSLAKHNRVAARKFAAEGGHAKAILAHSHHRPGPH